jgi:hypothetical protein
MHEPVDNIQSRKAIIWWKDAADTGIWILTEVAVHGCWMVAFGSVEDSRGGARVWDKIAMEAACRRVLVLELRNGTRGQTPAYSQKNRNVNQSAVDCEAAC